MAADVFKRTQVTSLFLFNGYSPGAWPFPGLLLPMPQTVTPPLSNFALPLRDSLSDTLLQDAAGNLYGTTFGEGTHGYGSVFKLTPSNGNWIYTDLYDFTGGSDGAHPAGGVVMDAAGNLFGTTSAAGGPGKGTIFEITP